MVNGLSTASTLVLLLASGRWLSPVEGARILAVQTYAAKSHWNFMSGVLRSLTDVGHSVTAFTSFPDGDRENYTEVDLSKGSPTMMDKEFTFITEILGSPFAFYANIMDRNSRHCDKVYENQKFDRIVRGDVGSDRKFDLIIVEFRYVDCMSFIASALDLPIIYTVPSPTVTIGERFMTGHMSNPAVVSNLVAQQAVPKTFVQRLVNVALWSYGTLRVEYDGWMLKMTDPRRYQLSPKVDPSVIFLNTHHITEASRPVPPNLVEIGGIHLESRKELPKDVLDFIEDSPHGVIFFTFGSTVKLSTLPRHIEKSFKQVFANVSQRVLWKYEGEMKDKPENVMIKKWFPQRDVLLNPNVKLFISHGGISGVYEAVDGGVPVLGFPLIFDQMRNIDNLVDAQMAISLDLLTFSEEQLSNALSEIINNEKYTKNAKITSERFKDRPMTPQQSAVYWTEYVIRHKGAHHLKYHGLNLTWYQYFLLDVIFVILICTCLVLFVAYTILKTICKYALKYTHICKVKSQ